MIPKGFNRVEPDDRILDVFPTQTRVKGVELWEKWPAQRSPKGEVGDDIVQIIRIHNGKQQRFQLPRKSIEQALLCDFTIQLNPTAHPTTA